MYWLAHIDMLENKLSGATHVIKAVRVNLKPAITMYFALFHSNMTYDKIN